jgi:adenosylcobinamide-GDP ribazoletransferase
MGATLAVERLARKHVGGQTGDVLGAVQQISEIAILCAALAAGSWW